jgi:hypothetical protein
MKMDIFMSDFALIHRNIIEIIVKNNRLRMHTKKLYPLCEHGYVIRCGTNITKEKSHGICLNLPKTPEYFKDV